MLYCDCLSAPLYSDIGAYFDGYMIMAFVGSPHQENMAFKVFCSLDNVNSSSLSELLYNQTLGELV